MHYQRGNNLILLTLCLIPVAIGLALFGYWYESGQPPWSAPFSSLPFPAPPDPSRYVPTLPVGALQNGGIAVAAVVVGLLLGAWIVMSLVDLAKLGYHSLTHHEGDDDQAVADEVWTSAKHG